MLQLISTPEATPYSVHVRAGHVRVGHVRAGNVRAGNVRAGHVRAGNVRVGHVKFTVHVIHKGTQKIWSDFNKAF